MSAENTSEKGPANEEIDLFDLFNRIGKSLSRFGRAVGRAILTTIIFLLKKWLPLGLSIVAGLGLSLMFKTISPPYFISDLVLRNNTITNADMLSYINRLHSYCREKNYNALSEAMLLSLKDVENIKDIGAYWIIDKGMDGISDFIDFKNKHNVYDTLDIRLEDRINIRVRIKSTNMLPVVRQGIISYINSDSLFQQSNRIRIRDNKELSARLNYDIIQLDSLQKVKYFEETRNLQPNLGGQIIFLQEQRTQLVYEDIYALYGRKQDLDQDKDLYPDIVAIISDFYLPVKRYNGGFYYGKMIIPLSFGLMLIFLLIKKNKDKLREIYNKY